MEHNDQHKISSDIAFTPSVKRLQQKFGSRSSYERMEMMRGWQSEIDTQLEAFIEKMDSFYMATSNTLGQPYIQHRGGPKGFLKVLDKNRLAFADFVGNKQYISTGNLSENNKAFIFLMDYPTRTRIKIWGTAEVEEEDSQLMDSLVDVGYRAKVERAIVFHVLAFDVNCPQHIQPRYTKAQLGEITDPLHKRITELEALVNKGNLI